MGHLRISAIIILILTSCTLRGQLGEINTESVNIGNTAGNAFWSIRQDSADNTKLEFFDSTNVILELDANGTAISARAHIFPVTDQTYILGADISGTHLLWLNVMSETLQAGRSDINGGTPVQGKINLNNSSATSTASGDMQGVWDTSMSLALIEVGNMRIASSGNFFNRTYTGSDASCSGIDDGWIGLRTDSNELQYCLGSTTKKVPVKNNANVFTENNTFDHILFNADGTYDIGENNTRPRDMYIDDVHTERLLINNSGHTNNWTIRQDTGDNQKLEFFAGAAVHFEIDANGAVNIAGNVMPTADSTYTMGVDGTRWDTVNADTLNLRGTGTEAELTGILKDGQSTIEADNFAIDSAGNFYTRPITGDATCTTTDDGWFAAQTTSEELQWCSGGVTRLTPSVLTSDTPVTVNCGAGEVIDDPEFKNGILIGTAGTPCIAN